MVQLYAGAVSKQIRRKQHTGKQNFVLFTGEYTRRAFDSSLVNHYLGDVFKVV